MGKTGRKMRRCDKDYFESFGDGDFPKKSEKHFFTFTESEQKNLMPSDHWIPASEDMCGHIITCTMGPISRRKESNRNATLLAKRLPMAHSVRAIHVAEYLINEAKYNFLVSRVEGEFIHTDIFDSKSEMDEFLSNNPEYKVATGEHVWKRLLAQLRSIDFTGLPMMSINE